MTHLVSLLQNDKDSDPSGPALDQQGHIIHTAPHSPSNGLTSDSCSHHRHMTLHCSHLLKIHQGTQQNVLRLQHMLQTLARICLPLSLSSALPPHTCLPFLLLLSPTPLEACAHLLLPEVLPDLQKAGFLLLSSILRET